MYCKFWNVHGHRTQMGTSINDVLRFLAIFDLPTLLPCPCPITSLLWGYFGPPPPTLISDVINGPSRRHVMKAEKWYWISQNLSPLFSVYESWTCIFIFIIYFLIWVFCQKILAVIFDCKLWLMIRYIKLNLFKIKTSLRSFILHLKIREVIIYFLLISLFLF